MWSIRAAPAPLPPPGRAGDARAAATRERKENRKSLNETSGASDLGPRSPAQRPARSGALRPARLRRPPHPACRDPAPGRPGASVVGMYGAALPTYPDRSRIARPVGRRHRAHSGRAGLDARRNVLRRVTPRDVVDRSDAWLSRDGRPARYRVSASKGIYIRIYNAHLFKP